MISLLQNPRLLTLTVLAATAGVLGAALMFQFIGGLAPCPMCLWQRWPYVAGMALAALALLAWRALGRPLLALGVPTFLIGAALGAYHAGVEWRWWPGPTSCSAPISPGDLSTDELLAQIMATPIVRCDEIVWQFLGLSMAGWNAVISLGLAGLCILAVRSYGSSSASQ